MQSRSAIKRPLLKELLALLLFLMIGVFLAMPVLCPGGDVAARYKAAIVLAAFSRLAWQLHKNTFRFRDYFIYLAVMAGLCLWMDLSLC